MKVKLKNGMIGNLVGDVHIIFDNGDTYSYTVPTNDIVEEVKNKNYKNMNKEELNAFNTNDWSKCVSIIEKYWNDDYGTFDIEGKNNNITLTLTTGGWSENEAIINLIYGTMFWFLWWQESKRGGYYKFTIVDKIEYERSE